MSRAPPEKYVVLKDFRFHELCGFLALKGQCCSDPDKKVIERAFRKKALKTHPDKGGDPVEFKKVNDAYNRLIGHITKLEILNDETELACNSIIIEISKVAVVKWRDKLKKCYGVPKCDNVKNLVFEGPYEQFRGRSMHTGPITVVLYMDPEDCIPKLHIQADKYMAWITEQRMPLHLHVDKGRQIQFDQWRICHLAEFGLCSFMSNAYTAPPPPPTPTPKPKRKAREKNTEPKPKNRRDSTPKEKEEDTKQEPTDTKNSSEAGKPDEIDADWEEVIENPNDPKITNIEDQTFVKNGKRYRKKSAKPPTPKAANPEAKSFENKPFTCGQCGTGYNDCGDYSRHKQMCIPDEEFEEMREYFEQTKEETKNSAENSSMDIDVDSLKNNITKTKTADDNHAKSLSPIREEVSKPVTTPSEPPPAFICKNCNCGYPCEVTFKRHSYICKSTKSTKSKLKQKNSTETDTNLSDSSSARIVQNSSGHDKGENGDVKKDKMGENGDVKKDKIGMDCNDMYAMLGKLNESIHDDNKSDIKANTEPSSKGQNSRSSQISETHKPLDTNINIPNNVQSKNKLNEPNDISASKMENITLTELSRKPNGCELPSDNPVHPHSKQIRMSKSDSLTPKATQNDSVATNGEHKQSNLQKDNSPSAKLGQKITNGNAQEVSKDSKINKTTSAPKIEAKTSKITKPWRQSNPEINKFNVEKCNIPTNSKVKVPEKSKPTLNKNLPTAAKEKQLDEFEIISQTCNKVTAPTESTEEKVKIVLKDKEEKMQMDVSQDKTDNPQTPKLEKNLKNVPPKDDNMVKSGAQTTNSSLYSKPSGIQMASHTTLEQESKDSFDLQPKTAPSISQISKDKVIINTSNLQTKEKLNNTPPTSVINKTGLPNSTSSSQMSKINVTNSTPTTVHQSQSNGLSSKTIKDNVITTTSSSVPQNNGLSCPNTKDKVSSVSITPTNSSPSHQSNGVSSATIKSKTTATTKTTSARGAQLKTQSSANQNSKEKQTAPASQNHSGQNREEPIKRRRNESMPADQTRPKSEKVIYLSPNSFCQNEEKRNLDTPFSPKLKRSQSSKIFRLLQKFTEVEV